MRSNDADASGKVTRSQSRAKLAAMVAGAFLASTAAVAACLWDSDTLKQEIEAGENNAFILGAITGRFDRFPPLYYEMRLERVTDTLDTTSGVDTLEACDDAGVACDKLGRPDEAIEWMAQKAEYLEAKIASPEELSEHRYRYFANLGTFHVHRWLKASDPERDANDLEKAHQHISAALSINPDAHFGRERVQLRVIEWLRGPTVGEGKKTDPSSYPLGEFLRYGTDEELRDLAVGLAGMIRLGAAWESPDIFNALGTILSDEQIGTLSYLAWRRHAELLHNGRSGICYHRLPDPLDTSARLESYRESRMADYWSKARPEAQSWIAKRMEFIDNKLKTGEHPDTHPAFWADFRSNTEAPELEDFRSNTLLGGFVKTLLIPCALIGGLAFYLFFHFKRKRRLAHA